jgi:cystathionine beta-synthase/cysteine synthase A
VQAAERAGLLRPGGIIIESTSGNFGKALALIGAARGYRVILVVDPKVPASTLAFVTALGAELVMVDQADEQGSYQRPRIARVGELLTQHPGAFWTDQYNNENNPRVHAESTSQELLRDLGEIDAVVAAVSTGGHLSGLSRGLKRQLPDLTVIGVDAVGSAAFGFDSHRYAMRGLGLAWKPGNLHLSRIDYAHRITDAEGITTSRVVARTEGLLVGESSGAVIFAALHFADANPGARVVAVTADGAVNYLSESFDEGWLAGHGLPHELPTAKALIAAAREPAHRPVRVAEFLLAGTPGPG